MDFSDERRLCDRLERGSASFRAWTLVLALGVAACGSDGDDDTGTISQGGTSSSSGGAGGRAASAGAGGSTAGSGVVGEAGKAGCDPLILEAGPKVAQAAMSEGFSGTSTQYSELYSVSCTMSSECETACAERGGSTAMCAASECVESEKRCLPATAWFGTESLPTEGEDPNIDFAMLTLVSNPYRDRLIVSDFGFAVPSNAEIVGITIEIRRAADTADLAVDDSVRIVKGGELGSTDRSKSETWGTLMEDVIYGAADDLWGETWTPEAVNAPDFGVALTTRYTDTSGVATAYVDVVRARIDYRAACD